MHRIGGRPRNGDASRHGAAVPVRIPPLQYWILTSSRNRLGTMSGGSLTGRSPPKGYRRRSKVPQNGRKPFPKSAKAEGSLTATPTVGAGTKVGLSDPVVLVECHRSTDKSYPGDNRLISPKSSHRRGGLAPRCRLVASWGCSRSQGLGCSPIKAARELGSERRETVRSLSGVGVGYLRGADPVREDRVD